MRFALTITKLLLIYVLTYFFPGEATADPFSVSFSEKPEHAVLWGAGIKKGMVIPYAELIDVVPTVCELMEVEYPKTCRGRTIVEALSGYGGDIPPRNMFIKEMLDQFVSYRKKMAEARYVVEKITSGKQGFLFTQLNRQISRNFYDINRFTEWPRFNSIEELLENNRETMKKLETLLLEIKNTN